MIIRQLTNGELMMAVELKHQCWNEDYAGIIPRDSMNINEELAFLNRWLNEKSCNDVRRIYGAFEEDAFIGFVGGSFAEKEDSQNGVEINYLFVKGKYRGRGIGLKLMKILLAEFKEHGVEQVIVYSWHNSKSNGLYRNGLAGKLQKQVVQTPKGKETLVDIFSWDINQLITLLDKLLKDPMNGE